MPEKERQMLPQPAPDHLSLGTLIATLLTIAPELKMFTAEVLIAH